MFAEYFVTKVHCATITSFKFESWLSKRLDFDNDGKKILR